MAAQAANLHTETKIMKTHATNHVQTTKVAIKVSTDRHMLVDRMRTRGMILSTDHKECVTKSAVQTIIDAAETSSLVGAFVCGTWP